MKCILLFFSISLLFAFGIAPSNNSVPFTEKGIRKDSDTIYWSKNRKLTWADYKGIPDKSKKFTAITKDGLSWNIIKSKDSSRIIVKTFFLKNVSWVLPNASLAILKHEQGHFDIEEVYARILRKYLVINKFDRFTQVDHDVYRDRINNLLDEYIDKLNNIQATYDSETHHGMDSLFQSQWNIRIANDLKSLEAYSNPDDK